MTPLVKSKSSMPKHLHVFIAFRRPELAFYNHKYLIETLGLNV